MFSNELLSASLSLNQEHHQFCQESSNANEQNDFTFDQYLPQSQNINSLQTPQTDTYNQSSLKINFANTYYTENDKPEGINFSENQSELQVLKRHLSTIETIAMTEIQELKKILELQKQQKQKLSQEIETIKQANEQKVSSTQNQVIILLKEENKMLKEALKKQIHINKNLIKSSIVNSSKNEHPQSQTQKAQCEKENISPNIIAESPTERDAFKSSLFDRPSIPHPAFHLKKNSIRS